MLKNEWAEWQNSLFERIGQWLESETTDNIGKYYCRQCGGLIIERSVFCSRHDMFKISGRHAGSGGVIKFPVPECNNPDCANNRPAYRSSGLKMEDETLYGPCIDY